MKYIGMCRWFVVIAVAGGAAPTALAEAAGDVELGRGKAAACATCHGAGGVSVNPNVPHLRGQQAEYLVNAMTAYKTRGRRDPLAVLMYPPVDNLTAKDMQDLAAYYASLGSEPGGQQP